MTDNPITNQERPEARPVPHEIPARQRTALKLMFGSFGVLIVGVTIIAVAICIALLIAIS